MKLWDLWRQSFEFYTKTFRDNVTNVNINLKRSTRLHSICWQFGSSCCLFCCFCWRHSSHSDWNGWKIFFLGFQDFYPDLRKPLKLFFISTRKVKKMIFRQAVFSPKKAYGKRVFLGYMWTKLNVNYVEYLPC